MAALSVRPNKKHVVVPVTCWEKFRYQLGVNAASNSKPEQGDNFAHVPIELRVTPAKKGNPYMEKCSILYTHAKGREKSTSQKVTNMSVYNNTVRSKCIVYKVAMVKLTV